MTILITLHPVVFCSHVRLRVDPPRTLLDPVSLTVEPGPPPSPVPCAFSSLESNEVPQSGLTDRPPQPEVVLPSWCSPRPTSPFLVNLVHLNLYKLNFVQFTRYLSFANYSPDAFGPEGPLQRILCRLNSIYPLQRRWETTHRDVDPTPSTPDSTSRILTFPELIIFCKYSFSLILKRHSSTGVFGTESRCRRNMWGSPSVPFFQSIHPVMARGTILLLRHERLRGRHTERYFGRFVL